MNAAVHTLSGSAPESSSGRGRQVAFIALGLLVLGLIGWGLSRIHLGEGHAPKRQTVKISLPDTPPPPPPPKQEEKRPPPKEESKPTPQMEPKPEQAPPAPAQSLKMEGAAGDGPSAFSSGSVSQDYKGGQVVSGNGGPAGVASDRAKYQFYVNSVKQMLKDELERHLQGEQHQLVVAFALWVKPDGGIERYELLDGSDRVDDSVRAAFNQLVRNAHLPPPKDTPQPLRMRMTLLPPSP